MRWHVVVALGIGCGAAQRDAVTDNVERLRGTVATPGCKAEQLEVACVHTRHQPFRSDCDLADVDLCGSRTVRYRYYVPNPNHPGPYDDHWLPTMTNLSSIYQHGFALGDACRSVADRDTGRDPVFLVRCTQQQLDRETVPDCVRAEIEACGKLTRYQVVACAYGQPCFADSIEALAPGARWIRDAP